MTSANWDEVGKAMSRDMNADRVEDYFKKPLQESICQEGERSCLAASDDLLMLLVLTYIDLLGYLYKGSSKSVCAVEFIREYLGRVDQRYAELGSLLYYTLRHGMVHLATPKRIRLQDGKILDFLFIRSRQREDCFKIVKIPEAQRTGTVDIYRLTLDIPLLYRDLLSAIDMYAEDIRHNQALSDVFRGAFETRRKPERSREEEIISRQYIRDSDFAFVREQISKL